MVERLLMHPFAPVIAGLIAMVLWAICPVMALELKRIPLFQLIATVTTVGIVFTSLRITVRKKWSLARQPYFFWVIGLFCIGINEIAFLTALKLAPPAHVSLVIFLWPILVVTFSYILPNEQFRWSSLLSACLGFLGMIILFSSESEFSGIYPYSLWGYVAAFISAVSWTIYSLCSRAFSENKNSELVGLYFLGVALICMVLHFSRETTVLPSAYEWSLLIMLGMGIQGLSYSLWDFGIKRGPFQFLNIISYCTPLLTISFLVLFGKASATPVVILATLLFTVGGALPSLLSSRGSHPPAEAAIAVKDSKKIYK